MALIELLLEREEIRAQWRSGTLQCTRGINLGRWWGLKQPGLCWLALGDAYGWVRPTQGEHRGRGVSRLCGHSVVWGSKTMLFCFL